ncbi:MAG: hypothetical protein SPL10_04840 [Synergistales bacterium]|nr:hypothetical protein [Synergistales bacterium]MDY6402326.1 hypothetical protein [Synergistales bacterium]MDY6405213.1 hypothetical protein [Synergistales bacterium]MDY6409873.1 hypothetical protein [Synergistales bacterium]MDY6414468.1 hypothetical protein [Synergistales bacterium]
MKRKNFQRLIFLWLFIFAWASPGLAGTWTVTSSDSALKITSSDNTVSFDKFSDLSRSLSSGDVISFNAGTYNIASSDYLIVSACVTINGTGATIDAQSEDRTFPVITFSGDASGSTVTGLTITNAKLKITSALGYNSGGAGILIDSVSVTVDSCTFTNNRVYNNYQPDKTSPHEGGAGIFTKDADGTIIKNSTFNKNTVSVTVNESGGNGIYNLASSDNATIIIQNCIFSENAISEDAVVTGAEVNASGGAIVNAIAGAYTLTVSVDNCSFDQNSAGRYGGALYSITDAAGSIDITVTNSSFTKNELKGYANNGSFGGAIACYAAEQGYINLTLSDTVFTGNKALNKALNSNVIGAGGGAVCIYTLNTSADRVNAAITNCLFDSNESNIGGAVVNWGNSGKATMTIENCTFSGNKAISDDVFAANAAAPYPIGGAFVTKAKADGSAASVYGKALTTIINCTFENNSSVSGGTIASYKDSGSTASTDIINCTFVNNYTVSADNTTLTTNKATDIYNMGEGTINVLNTLLWNSSKDNIISKDNGTISLDHSALPAGASLADDITSSYIVFVSTDWSPVSSEATNGTITHTIFVLSGDKNKPLAVLAAKGVSNDKTPTTDQVGTTRNDRPYIGAAEGPEITLALKSLSLDISPASESINFTVGSDTVSIDLSASFDLTVSGDYVDYVYDYLPTKTISLDKGSYDISWQIVSDDWTGYGLYVDSNKFYVSKDATVGEYSVIIAAVVSSGDNITNSKDVIINITVANISPDITASGTSFEFEKGATISDITITMSNDAQNIIWSISPDLSNGLTFTSTDSTATISGTVSTSATTGSQAYTITASNDIGSADVEITITIKEQTPEFSSSNKYYFEVVKGQTGTHSLSVSQGTNLTWSLVNAPTWVTLSASDSTATITAKTPSLNSLGNHIFNVVVSNETNSDTQLVTVNVIQSSSSSSSLPVNSEGYYEGETAQAPVISSDKNGNAVVTTFTEFKNSNGDVVLSADITMTIASEDFEGVVSEDFSKIFSVDVNLNVIDLDYKNYKFSMEASPDLPSGLEIEISGDVSSDTFTASGDISYSYTVTISGTPSASFDEAVNLKAVVKIDGDTPGLMAYASRDVNFIISGSVESDDETDTLEAISVKISGDNSLSVNVGKGGSMTLDAVVSGNYSVSGTKTLDSSLYALTWSIDSGDTAGISLDEDGTLTVTDEVEIGEYRIPVKVSAQTTDGALSADASKNITVRVVNTAPEIDASLATVPVDLSSGDYEIPDVTVEAVAGENLTWTTSGTLPKGLTLTSSDEIFTISGVVPSDTEMGTYSYTFTAENEIGSDTLTIVFNVFTGGTVTGLEPTIDSNGRVTFTAPSSRVGFAELLNKLAESGIALTDVKELVIPSGVTDLNGIEALTNLTKLDLTSASSLTTMKLGSSSSVTEINLSGNGSVTSVDLSGSNIQSLDLDGSVVANVNLAYCTNLTTLTCEAASGTGSLEEIILTGCENLENLSCSGNKLLWLDLSDCTKLKSPRYSGQRRSGSSVKRNFSSRINFWRLLWDLLNNGAAYDESATKPYDVANISGVSYASNDVYVEVTINSDGYVNLPFVPVAIKYNYNTGHQTSSASYGSVSVSDESAGTMEVTLSTGESSSGTTEESHLGPANVGCNFGFGPGIFAAFLAFAALKKRSGK